MTLINNLPDFCVSSSANGFDEFLKVYSEYFRYDYQGFNLFYGVKNNDENYDDKAWTTNIITPFEAIALLTAKPLTEGKIRSCANCKETIQECACMRNICVKCNKPVGNITFSVCDYCWNRFKCIEDVFMTRYGMTFSRGCNYTCEATGTIMSNEGINHVLSENFLKRHFKLLPTTQEDERQMVEDVLIDSQVAILESQVDAEREKNKHLQQQLDEAKELLKEAELVFRKHAIISKTRVSINEFLKRNK